jgi:hypothetical protein
MTFDPVGLCRALEVGGVRYVLIGGLAATVHGAELATVDVDVVPARDADNLERLAAVLIRLRARLRTEAGPVDVPLDAGFLEEAPVVLTLTTDLGDLDLVLEPAGPAVDFADWDRGAVRLEVGEGLMVRVGGLDDLIAAKRATGRAKDLAALPLLESLRDLVDDGSADGIDAAG